MFFAGLLRQRKPIVHFFCSTALLFEHAWLLVTVVEVVQKTGCRSCTLRRTRFRGCAKSVSNSFHRLDKIGQLGLKKR